MRRVICLAVALVVVAVPTPAALAAPAEQATWVRPVEGPVVVPFRPGTGRFGLGGHTGLDLSAPPGTPVRAAGPGTVTFAGGVAGDRFVVVAHGGGLRTTYGFLATVAATRGDRVVAGQTVGSVGGGRGHPTGTLHFGLRHGDDYLDPLVLFEPSDLTELVRLVPSDGPVTPVASAAQERRRLAAEFGRRGALPGWVAGRDGATGVLGGAASALGRGARWLVRQTGQAVVSTARAAAHATRRVVEGLEARGGALARHARHFALERLTDLRRIGPPLLRAYVLHQLKWGIRLGVAATTATALGPLAAYQLGVMVQEVAWEAGRGLRDWWVGRHRCSSGPVPTGASGAAPSRLVAVGGVNSRPGGTGNAPTFDLPAGRLGYAPGAVRWFSYPDGADPEPGTWSGVERAAAQLARDLRAEAATRPTSPVDLVGHSLGGLVIEAFLKLHHRGHEHEFPPIRRVVTLAAPHRGSALAGQVRRYARLPLVGDLADAAAGALGEPGPSTQTVRDLAPGSPLLRRLDATPLPDGVDVTTIGAVGDWFVTADSTRLAGATHVVVDPAGFRDHRGAATSRAALDAARRALAGVPPACRSALEAVRHRVQPAAMRVVIEHADAVVAGARRAVSSTRDALGALRGAR